MKRLNEPRSEGNVALEAAGLPLKPKRHPWMLACRTTVYPPGPTPRAEVIDAVKQAVKTRREDGRRGVAAE